MIVYSRSSTDNTFNNSSFSTIHSLLKLRIQHKQLQSDYQQLVQINYQHHLEKQQLLEQLEAQYEASMDASIVDELVKFFSSVGTTKNGECIPYVDFDPKEMVTTLKRQYKNLYTHICNLVLSPGCYRNKLKTPAQKLLRAISHFASLAHIRNQQTCTYLPMYFGLVSQAIGISKIGHTFSNTLSTTSSYYSIKNYLDNRAENFQSNFDNQYPPNHPLLFLWDNWVFRTTLKHERLDKNARMVHTTIRAIIILPPIPESVTTKDLIYPQPRQSLKLSMFQADETDVHNQHCMKLWILSRSAKSVLQFPQAKTKYEHAPTRVKVVSAPILFEDETTNSGTQTILHDFVDIGSIRHSDEEPYLHHLYQFFETVGVDCSDFHPDSEDNTINNPARLFALGAGDCLTYNRVKCAKHIQHDYGEDLSHFHTSSRIPPL